MSGPNIKQLSYGDSVPEASTPEINDERESAAQDFVAACRMVPLKNGEPIAGEGPFALTIEKTDRAIGLTFQQVTADAANADAVSNTAYTVSFSLSPLRRNLKDYAQIVASYYDAIRTGQAAKIEAVDMARRGIHNEAAETLVERLDGKVAMDHDAARRLFTVINAIRYDGRGGMQ